MIIKNLTKTVLIADDDKGLLDHFKTVFERHDFKVITACDGLDASNKVKNQAFDIIVTDIQMPKKSGLKLIKDIKQDSVQMKVPIIILSANPGDIEVKEIMQKYSNVKALQKPIEAQSIVKLAEAFIKLSEKLNSPVKQEAVSKGPKKLEVKEGETLIHEGEDGNTLYWLAVGKMEVYTTKDNGEELILGQISKGELVGEMSFLNDKKRSASVRALEHSQVLEIPVNKFSDVLTSQPAWFQSLVKTLSTRLHETSKKLSV
jgi:CheY-like chemotaxis protein